jgi:hypothetical protein
MGTSYQTLLVVADLADVHAALVGPGADGLVMPAGPGRTAVMPREGAWDVADVAKLAAQLGSAHGWPIMTNMLHDSDVVLLGVYHQGRLVHDYISDQTMLVDWFIDDDDVTKFRIGDVEYPAGAPVPTGPAGADPVIFAPFGVGDVDADQLGRYLRGETGEPKLFAERQHELILEALHLDPRGLTIGFRHTGATGLVLPGAVRVAGG